MKKIFFLLFLLSCSHQSLAPLNNNHLRYYAFDVGNASCSLVLCPKSKEAILFDCGQRQGFPKSEAADKVLRELGERTYTIILSHAHIDHYSVISTLVKKRKPEAIFYAGKIENYKTKLEGAQSLSVGQSLSCGAAQGSVLTVNERLDADNDSSAVFLLQYNKTKLLLPADATGLVEEKAKQKINSEIDLLIASHHGESSRKSNSEDWAHHIKAKMIVYSSGTYSGFTEPKCKVAKRYEPYLMEMPSHDFSCWEGNKEIIKVQSTKAEFNTSDLGDLVFESDGEKLLKVK